MKTTIQFGRPAPFFASPVTRVLLALALVFSFTFLFPAEALAQQLFQKPNDGAAQPLFDGILRIVQILCFLLYILAIFWVYEGMKAFKEGNSKEGWQNLIGAFGIFISPGIVALFRTIAANYSTIS